MEALRLCCRADREIVAPLRPRNSPATSTSRPAPVSVAWRCSASSSSSSSTRTEAKQAKKSARAGGVKRETNRNVKGNPPRRVGKKVVKDDEGDGLDESSSASGEFAYGGAVSVFALEPREEYSSSQTGSVSRLKDLKKTTPDSRISQVCFECIHPRLKLHFSQILF